MPGSQSALPGESIGGESPDRIARAAYRSGGTPTLPGTGVTTQNVFSV
jgi:uncharacterized protein (DUF433 family)